MNIDTVATAITIITDLYAYCPLLPYHSLQDDPYNTVVRHIALPNVRSNQGILQQ